MSNVKNIKYWAYGKLGLKPSELYVLDLVILCDMILAYMRVEEEIFDKEMIQLSWQTAILMNSTGNYKKKIKPEDLYVPLDEQKKKIKTKAEGLNQEKRQKLQKELLSAFADSNVKIQ